jgi:urocanate reductase
MSREPRGESTVSVDQSIKSMKENEMGEEIEAPRRISRKEFVKGAALGAGALAGVGALASCAPAATPAPTTAPGGTAAPAPTCPPAAECTPCAVSGVPQTWDKEADVIVVGTGTGTVAAVAAVDSGASVILLDQNKEFGGSTVINGGVVLDSGGGTPTQKANGVSDTPEEFFARLSDPHVRDYRKSEPELLQAYCTQFPVVAAWLQDHGVQYTGNFFNLNMGPIDLNTVIVCEEFSYDQPTVFNPLQPAGPWRTGAGLIYPLKSYAEGKGVQVLLENKMTHIIREPGSSGSVLGVEVETSGGTSYFKANKGVILATGSYKGGKFIRTAYDPRITPDIVGSGEPWVYDDGSGMQAGLEVGGVLTGHEQFWHIWHRHFGTLYHQFPLGSPYAPPGLSISGDGLGDVIFVNSSGQRFVSEGQSEYDNLEGSFYDYALPQKDHKIWTIFDDAAAQKNKWDLAPQTPPVVAPDLVFSANTIADLASSISVPADALSATVSSYNTYVAAGSDPDFSKPKDLLTSKIETPPFHAVWVSMQFHDSMSGLMINANGQVLDAYGEAIPHLYAHGEVSGGLDVGLGMSHGIIIGYICGQHAAAQQPTG